MDKTQIGECVFFWTPFFPNRQFFFQCSHPIGNYSAFAVNLFLCEHKQFAAIEETERKRTILSLSIWLNMFYFSSHPWWWNAERRRRRGTLIRCMWQTRKCVNKKETSCKRRTTQWKMLSKWKSTDIVPNYILHVSVWVFYLDFCFTLPFFPRFLCISYHFLYSITLLLYTRFMRFVGLIASKWKNLLQNMQVHFILRTEIIVLCNWFLSTMWDLVKMIKWENMF